MVESFVIFIPLHVGDRTQFQIPARSQIFTLAPIGWTDRLAKKMKKGIIRILTTLGFLTILIVFGGYWFLRQAFGPLERTVEIEISNSQTLICQEIYNADFAAVFYDVDFKLIDNEQTFDLGAATFSKDSWDKDLKLYSIGDWYVLPTKDNSYLKILTTNRKNGIHKDTVLSPHDLKSDEFWKSKNKEFPAWIYTGSSELDFIDRDEMTVVFEYRLGDYEPFTFVRQKIKYQLDNNNGDLLTTKIFNNEQAR